MTQLLIVVSKNNTLIDYGSPEQFTDKGLRKYLAEGHIIRQVTETDFQQSPLKPKE